MNKAGLSVMKGADGDGDSSVGRGRPPSSAARDYKPFGNVIGSGAMSGVPPLELDLGVRVQLDVSGLAL